MELLEEFLPYAKGCLKHVSERARLEVILGQWAAKWTGKQRLFDYSRSHHGAFLHFNQLMGGKWVQAFTFVATRREGVCLRGPEPDRDRKAHKFRHNPLDAAPLDALFEAWSLHPRGPALRPRSGVLPGGDPGRGLGGLPGRGPGPPGQVILAPVIQIGQSFRTMSTSARFFFFSFRTSGARVSGV